MNNKSALVVLVSVCLLAACGGGGGATPTPPPSPTPSPPPPQGAAANTVTIKVVKGTKRYFAIVNLEPLVITQMATNTITFVVDDPAFYFDGNKPIRDVPPNKLKDFDCNVDPANAKRATCTFGKSDETKKYAYSFKLTNDSKDKVDSDPTMVLD
jgi:hypothetical protein